MTEVEERTGLIKMLGSIAGIFLGIFLLFFSFFLHYINEMSNDPVQVEKIGEKQMLFDAVLFGDYSQMAQNYKQEFLSEMHNGHQITNWMFRLLAIFCMWLGFTLIFVPLFTKYEKERLGMYSLYLALALSFIFIAGVWVYTFALNGGFDFLKFSLPDIGGWFQFPTLPRYLYFLLLLLFLALLYALYYYYFREEKDIETEKRVGAFKVYEKETEKKDTL